MWLDLEMNYLYAFLTTFCSVGLKGLQHKNVIHNRYFSIAVVSYLMAIADIAFVGLIVKNGWAIVFWVGSGAAVGMVLAVWLSNHIEAKKNPNV